MKNKIETKNITKLIVLLNVSNTLFHSVRLCIYIYLSSFCGGGMKIKLYNIILLALHVHLSITDIDKKKGRVAGTGYCHLSVNPNTAYYTRIKKNIIINK